MSTTYFKIQEHSLPATHIREYPRATALDQEDVLHLAIKQYTPLETVKTGSEAITIIGAHANGFPKVRPLLVGSVSPFGPQEVIVAGTLRTSLGRSVRTIESAKHSHTQYMDRGCRATRWIGSLERIETGQRS